MRTPNTPFLALLALLTSSALRAQTPTHQHVHHNLIGSSLSTVNGVATDSQGDLIVCGGRLDALDFGGATYAAGTGGIFLAKFAPSGAELWSKVAGSAETSGNHKATSVAVDASDNIYLAGWLFAPQAATFDGTTLPAGSLGFVAKYSPAGVLIWVQEFSANVNAIAVDGNGTPFINLGDATIEKLDPSNGNSTASGTGGGDLMNVVYHNIVVDDANNVIAQWGNKITKYDNDLVTQWSAPLVKGFGSESFRISVGTDGHVWATFYAIFGTVTLGGTDYTTFPNGYIYELDGANGAVLGCDALTIGGTANKPKEVITDGVGNLYMNGNFAFNASYIMKLDPAFAQIWAVPTFNVEDMAVQGTDCLSIGGNHAADITLDGVTYTRPNASGQENAMAAYLCAGGVGMEDGAFDRTIALHPVPCDEHLTITGIDAAPATVRIFDALGHEHPSAARLVAGRVDVAELAPGPYVLIIAQKGRTTTARFIKR